MLNEILEDGGVELVHDLLAVALGENESRFTKPGEVARDGRPRSGKVVGNVPGGLWTITEESQDLATGGIGERAEGIHASQAIS